MNFISPKTDFAFKKIFGSTDSKDILISFLKALLYNEKPVIEDLEKREMFIEDQQGAIIKGIQQGIQEGQQALIMGLLERRVGEIVLEIQSCIRRLSSKELETLGVAFFDFTSASDLIAWLQSDN